MSAKKHNLLWALEHFITQERSQIYIKGHRRKQQLLAEQALQSEPGEILPITTLTNPSKKEFLKSYIEHKPILLKAFAKEWPCVKKWSLKYFKDNHGDIELPFFDETKGYASELISKKLSDAIDEYNSGDNTTYCKFSNALYLIPSLRKDISVDQFYKLVPKFHQKGTLVFFLGPKGSKTSLHNALGNNFFTQVHGRKVWYIYPIQYTDLFHPQVTYSPQFLADEKYQYPHQSNLIKHIKYWKVELEPGDVLFIPSYLWHTVENLTDNIAFKTTWTSPRSFTRSPIMSMLTLYNFGPNILNLKKEFHHGKFAPKKFW